MKGFGKGFNPKGFSPKGWFPAPGKGASIKGACWGCGQLGHTQANCPNGKSKGKGQLFGKGKGSLNPVDAWGNPIYYGYSYPQPEPQGNSQGQNASEDATISLNGGQAAAVAVSSGSNTWAIVNLN